MPSVGKGGRVKCNDLWQGCQNAYFTIRKIYFGDQSSKCSCSFHNKGYTTCRKLFTDSTTTHRTLHLDLEPAKSSSRNQNLFSYHPQFITILSSSSPSPAPKQLHYKRLTRQNPYAGPLRNNQNYCRIQTSLNNTICS